MDSPNPCGGGNPTAIGTDGDAGEIGMFPQINFFGFFVEIDNEAPPAVALGHGEFTSSKVEACLPRLPRFAHQLRWPDLKVPIAGSRHRRDRPSGEAAVTTGNQTAIGGMKKNRTRLS